MDSIKIYKDKNTGKKYIKISDGAYVAIEDVNTLGLVEYKAENFAYTHNHYVTSKKKIDDILGAEYALKDTIIIPVGERNITFVVEHIAHFNDHDKVYFVAKDIVGKSSINDMESFLDDFEALMPEELVENMCMVEHIIEDDDGKEFVYRRKLNLLSKANMNECDGHSGDDDILFDGLKTEADRCKNYNGLTDYWWLRSPGLGSSPNFWLVGASGGFSTYTASAVFGVVPCFSIIINK